MSATRTKTMSIGKAKKRTCVYEWAFVKVSNRGAEIIAKANGEYQRHPHRTNSQWLKVHATNPRRSGCSAQEWSKTHVTILDGSVVPRRKNLQ